MKKRSTKHLKELQKKAVKYYFEKSDNNSLEYISKKFNIAEDMVSNAISKELKKRFDNSFSRRMSSY